LPRSLTFEQTFTQNPDLIGKTHIEPKKLDLQQITATSLI